MIEQRGKTDYSYERGLIEKKLREIDGQLIDLPLAKRYIGVALEYLFFLENMNMAGDPVLLPKVLDIFDVFHAPLNVVGIPTMSVIREGYVIAEYVAKKSGLEEKAKLMANRLSEIEELCGHS